jgi:hypothetical protein
MPTKEGTPTGPSDPRSEQSNPENREHPARSYGGVNVNKPKKELQADAREAGIEGRSNMSREQLADALQRYSERRTADARSR